MIERVRVCGGGGAAGAGLGEGVESGCLTTPEGLDEVCVRDRVLFLNYTTFKRSLSK